MAAVAQTLQPRLTLGPVLFNWPAAQWRDFYFRMADEAPLDLVYLGEVVCAKRLPFFEPLLETVAERLRRGGKTVVRSSPALVMNKRELATVQQLGKTATDLEINDASALWAADNPGVRYRAGPFLNTYNEAALAFLARQGISHVCLPPELPRTSLVTLGQAAAELGLSLETYVYGRVPLALSARCYHARAHGLDKAHCQFVCDRDPDGLPVQTLDAEAFLVVNGIQTLSHGCLNLLSALPALLAMGISHFRLSPQSQDMLAVSQCFADLLAGRIGLDEANQRLRGLGIDAPFCNGFYHGEEGAAWVGGQQSLLAQS